MKDMMKDRRNSVMVDVKDLLNEKMKKFMREMTMNLRNDITATMKDAINTKGEQQVNLIPNSQPELITQDSLQQQPRVKELNNLIDEMDIGKISNKRKAPTPSKTLRIKKPSNNGRNY